MKRLIAVTVLALAMVGSSVALASGGLGKFRSKLTGNSSKTEHGRLDGTWTIALSSPTSDRVRLTWNGHPSGGGTYTISGSRITFSPKRHGSCTTVGKYSFKLRGDTLTFTKIRDTCTIRRDVLTAGSWTKVG